MEVLNITSANFDAEVLQSDKQVLVDFWAPWCGPCKMIGPIVEEIATETPTIKVCKVNVDDAPDLAAKYGVMNIPTLMVFKDGKEKDTRVGITPKDGILLMLN